MAEKFKNEIQKLDPEELDKVVGGLAGTNPGTIALMKKAAKGKH